MYPACSPSFGHAISTSAQTAPLSPMHMTIKID
jgi:hypothetical protein